MSPEHIGLACDGSSSNPETTYFRGNWSKLSLKSQRSIFTVVCRRSYRKRQLCNQHSVCGNVRRTVNFGSEIDKRLSIPKVTRICLFRAGFITHSRIRQTIGSSWGWWDVFFTSAPRDLNYQSEEPQKKRKRSASASAKHWLPLIWQTNQNPTTIATAMTATGAKLCSSGALRRLVPYCGSIPSYRLTNALVC